MFHIYKNLNKCYIYAIARKKIWRKRTPRGDVDEFVGPMPDFKNYIEME